MSTNCSLYSAVFAYSSELSAGCCLPWTVRNVHKVSRGGGVGPADRSTGSVAFTNNFYFLQNRYKITARIYAAIQL